MTLGLRRLRRQSTGSTKTKSALISARVGSRATGGERMHGNRTTIGVVAAVAGLLWVGMAEPRAAAPAAPIGATPRDADGHPDLNGVWQVLNTANYDILPHPAR